MVAKVKYVSVSRCSSEEQKKGGHSHETQHKFIENNPRLSRWQCVGQFEETVSAWGQKKNRDRTIIVQIYNKVRKNPLWTDYVLFQKVDRFFRDQEYALHWIKKFDQYGVEVNFTDQWIEYGTGIANTMLGIYLGQASDESVKKSIRIKDTLQSIKRAGFYCWSTPPVGFDIVPWQNGKRKTLVPNSLWNVVQDALHEYSRDQFTASYLLNKYGKPNGISRTRFYEIFSNEKYAGLIYCDAYKNFGSEMIKAKWYEHRAIDKAIFDKNQKIKANRSRNGRKERAVTGPVNKKMFWLKGHIYCAVTGEPMTASSPTSKTKRRYHYYHSSKRGNGQQWVRADLAHALILRFFRELKLSEQVVELTKKKIRQKLAKIREQSEKNINHMSEELEKLQKGMLNMKKMFAMGDITIEEYRDLKAHNEFLLKSQQEELDVLKSEKKEMQQHLFQLPTYINDLAGNFENADYEGKDYILKAVFPEMLCVTENCQRLRTPRINSLILQGIGLQGVRDVLEVGERDVQVERPDMYRRRDNSRTLNSSKSLTANHFHNDKKIILEALKFLRA